MALIDSITSTALGLTATYAYDKYMKKGQEDSSKLKEHTEEILATRLTPVSLKMSTLVEQQSGALADLMKKMEAMRQESVDLKQQNMKLQEKLISSSVEDIPSSASKPIEQEPENHVYVRVSEVNAPEADAVKLPNELSKDRLELVEMMREYRRQIGGKEINDYVGKKMAHADDPAELDGYVAITDRSVTVDAMQALLKPGKLTLIHLPIVTMCPFNVDVARWLSDISELEDCHLVGIMKPDDYCSYTYRKFFKGDVYLDNDMAILNFLREGYGSSMMAKYFMASYWGEQMNMYFVKWNSMLESGVGESHIMENEARAMEGLKTLCEAAGSKGGNMAGGIMLLNDKGEAVWSYRSTCGGADFSTFDHVLDKVRECKRQWLKSQKKEQRKAEDWETQQRKWQKKKSDVPAEVGSAVDAITN